LLFNLIFIIHYTLHTREVRSILSNDLPEFEEHK